MARGRTGGLAATGRLGRRPLADISLQHSVSGAGDRNAAPATEWIPKAAFPVIVQPNSVLHVGRRTPVPRISGLRRWLMFEKLKERGFQVLALHHAEAILEHDMPEAATELEEVLLDIEIPAEELIRGGGGEGELTQRIRKSLAKDHGWRKHNFEIKKIVDGVEKESISHEIDHVKRFDTGTFALEIEWNNKDPFFDRDLENFKRLHADGVISIGSIITRGDSLQSSLRDIVAQFARKSGLNNETTISKYYTPTARQLEIIERSAKSKNSFEEGWAHAFVSDKFGEATTHWRKLEERVRRGVGNPCPLLLIGIPKEVVLV